MAGGGTMKKKMMSYGGASMKKKMMSRGGKMPMATDPKTGKKVPAFAVDGVGKMAKGGAMKKKMMAGGGAMKKKSYAMGGASMAGGMTPKTKKTMTGTKAPTMMKRGGVSKKKVLKKK